LPLFGKSNKPAQVNTPPSVEDVPAQDFTLKISYSAKSSESVRIKTGPNAVARLARMLDGYLKGEPELVEEPGVREKFGVTPDRVIDVLSLTGDTSDNVPGVPGVGEKTAIPLIQKYGTLEELYAHVGEIAQKGLREKLITHREKAFLSNHLVTIDTDVPLDLDFHSLRAAPRDTARLIRLFSDLEFKSLAARLRESEVSGAKPAAPPPVPPLGKETPETHAVGAPVPQQRQQTWKRTGMSTPASQPPTDWRSSSGSSWGAG